MAKEILLYGPIFDFKAQDFHDRLVEAESEGEDIILGINSDGGEVDVGFGMIRMFQKFSKSKHVEAHGAVRSMAAFFTLYADSVSALDVSEFVFHRAAFPFFIENDPELFTEERQQTLKAINKHLKTALLAKVDPNEFKRITGTSVNEMFSMEGRIDVRINAQDAKKLGIVDKIEKITLQKRSSIRANALKIAAHIEVPELPQANIKPIETEKPLNQNTIMDINKLQAEHTALYAEVLAKGVTQGIEQEKDRVQAWAVYADIDMKAVTEGIESGKAISGKAQAELNRKASSVEALKVLEGEAPEPNKPKAEAEIAGKKTEQEQNVTAFKDEVYKTMGIKTKVA